MFGHFRIEIKKDHQFEDIQASLKRELVRQRRGKEISQEQPRWKYCLWILPQSDGGRKMLRSHGGDMLRHMDVERLKQERVLYMEAHLVPVDGDGKV